MFEHHLNNLSVTTTAQGERLWQASTQRDGQDVPPAQATVLTLPAPQLLQLQGDIHSMLAESGVASRLEQVQYSARFALGLWFAPEKAAAVAAAVPGAGMYVDRESGLDVRFIAHDSAKRGVRVPDEEKGVSVLPNPK